MKNSIYVILAGCLWGIISIFINELNAAGFSSMQCVAIRAFFATFIIFIYLLCSDRKKLKIELKDVKYFIGTGVCSIVFFNYCYFKAIEVIGGASIPALLLYTAPIFVMLMSAVFFHERITVKKLAALIVAFLGLGFVTGAFGGSEKLVFSAFALGIGAGIGYALYSIFGKMVVEKYEAVTITFYTFLVAAVVSIVLSGIIPDLDKLCSIDAILPSLGLAFFSTVLPFLLYTKGLKGMEAGKASILATIEPFVAAIVGGIFFKEVFTPAKIIGMVMILASIIILNVNLSKKTVQ